MQHGVHLRQEPEGRQHPGPEPRRGRPGRPSTPGPQDPTHGPPEVQHLQVVEGHRQGDGHHWGQHVRQVSILKRNPKTKLINI